MNKLKFSSCYISAPSGTDLSPLREALEKRGITWTDQSSIRLGEPLLEAIENSINKADFICAVIPKESDYVNVLFELGIAHAKRKSVLIFVDQKGELPLFLQVFLYARSAINDENAVDFHLDSFLRYGSAKPKKKYTKFCDINKSIDTSWVSKAIQSLEEGNTTAFETLVARLFEESGIVVSHSPPHKDQGADIAIWIDQLQHSFGNPILVETKYGSLSHERLDEAEDKLRWYVMKTGGLVGLLIYLDSSAKDLPSSSTKWPLIIRLNFPVLVNLIQAGQLESELIKRRNKAVHGKV